MTDIPNPRPKNAIVDVPHAPFIFFEAAPGFGFENGIVRITLSAHRVWGGPDGAINDDIVVAYLRGSIQAAVSLRNALDSALLMAAPTDSKSN